MTYVDYTALARDLIIDVASIYVYAYAILYRRYGNKELSVSCFLFHISLLFVVMAIVRTDFNIAVGFGLFALLSLITVRSAKFKKTELAYFFGGVSLAVINGCGIGDYYFIIMGNVGIVLSAWLISAVSIEHSANKESKVKQGNFSVTLDHIDSIALNDKAVMKEKLETLFNLQALSFKIMRVDYVHDTIDLELTYEISKDAASKDTTTENESTEAQDYAASTVQS